MQIPVNLPGLEAQRQMGLLAWFGGVAVFVLVAISLVNVYQESYAFVPFTVGFSVVILVCIVLMYVFGWLRATMHAYGILMILLTAVMIISGGIQGNGFLWLFILPAVCFLLMGQALGAIYMGAIISTIVLLFFTPALAEYCYPYALPFKLRFLLALLGTAGISMFAEVSRCRISKRYHRVLEELELVTVTDPLTGFLNRRGGIQRLGHCHALAKRNNYIYSVLMVDIDHFKNINDTHGHNMGDIVLKESASVWAGSIREQDFGIRWGGKSFYSSCRTRIWREPCKWPTSCVPL